MILEDVAALVEGTERRITELEDETDGWTTVKENDDCVIFSRPSEDFSGYIFKSQGIIPRAPEVVLDLVAPGHGKPGRCNWDSSVASSITIEQLSTNIDIRLTRTLPVFMGLISAREFIDVAKVVQQPHRVFTVCIGLPDHPAAPRSKGFVRGTNYPNGTFCYRIDGKPNETLLVQYIHSDLGGSLPKSVIDSATPAVLANVYKQLKSALKKEKVKS